MKSKPSSITPILEATTERRLRPIPSVMLSSLDIGWPAMASAGRSPPARRSGRGGDRLVRNRLLGIFLWLAPVRVADERQRETQERHLLLGCDRDRFGRIEMNCEMPAEPPARTRSTSLQHEQQQDRVAGGEIIGRAASDRPHLGLGFALAENAEQLAADTGLACNADVT